MKKFILLFTFVLGLAFYSSAQEISTYFTEGSMLANPYNSKLVLSKNTTDTIWPTTILTKPCGDSLTAYIFDKANPVDTGYLSGNNKYGFSEIGTRVKLTGNANVTKVMVALLRKGNVGTGTCKVNLYSKGTNNLPATLLGSSTPITLSTLTVNTGAYCTFNFANSIAVSGDFFATVVLPTNTGDTIVLYSTKTTCTPDPDSISIFKYLTSHFYYKTFIGVNFDIAIGAIVDISTGITNNSIENVNVYSSNNEIVINNINNTNIKQVIIYNFLGQEVGNYTMNKTESFKLNANSLSSSNYIVKIVSDKKVGTYKLNLNR